MDVGDRIYHRTHGACRVVDRRSREIDGETVEYLEIATLNGRSDLQLLVPADRTEEMDVRDVVPTAVADELVAALAEPASEGFGELSWRKRRARTDAALDGGDPHAIAAAVRDLTLRHEEDGLNPTELQQLDRARRLLVGELAVAYDIDLDEARDRVEGALARAADAA